MYNVYMKTKEKKQGRTVLTISSDREFKQQAQQFAVRIGLSLSDFAKASMREAMQRGSITLEPVEYMTPKMEAYLAEIEDDIQHGRNLGPTLSTPQEIDDYFDKLMKKTNHNARHASSKAR